MKSPSMTGPNASHTLTRRAFLGAAAAGTAALIPKTGAASAFPWCEATIPELSAAMATGSLTSRELTQGYLSRIAELNPLLHAVIETNPQALAIAAGLDNERRRGTIRGPLHGIPILLKDNIGTNDTMQTTAGSLALVNSKVPGDAPLIAQLRAAGAVILGKANLGEWANFRGYNPLGLFGWSARGGDTLNPYVLSYPSFGSSSGSAVATAANLCSAAVGTETDGSITGPASCNLIVGLKPTLGLIPQQGIIPISHFQDTAGPMARTVTDVAITLGVLQYPQADYTGVLQRGALKGARIGVDRRNFDYAVYGYPGDDDSVPFALNAIAAMASLGATIVDVDTGDPYELWGYEGAAVQSEFKADIAQYLGTLTHTNLRTLTDLIAFNNSHCPVEMVYYGQETWEEVQATTGPDVVARQTAVNMARSGIDGAIARYSLDAIVAPHLTNTNFAAVAGYPDLALPVGVRTDGRPAGMLMYTGAWREARLLALAYDLEQELKVRVPPQFLGTPLQYPIFEGCTDPRAKRGKAHLPHGGIF